MQRETHRKMLAISHFIYGIWAAVFTPVVILPYYLFDRFQNSIIELVLKYLFSWLPSFLSWIESLIRGIKRIFDVAGNLGIVIALVLIIGISIIFFFSAYTIRSEKKWLPFVGGLAALILLDSIVICPFAPILGIYTAWYIFTAKKSH